MASHRQFQSAAEGVAMNRHDHGLSLFSICSRHRKQALCSLLLAGRDLAEFFYVGAGDKRSPGANQHHALYAIVLTSLFEGFGDPLRDGGTQCVYWRIIDCDDCDIFIFISGS